MKIKITSRLVFILSAVVIVGIYTLFDPAESQLFPKCFFHELTGWQCPGCGSQRMIHALLQGDLTAAWHYNAFLLLMLPVIIFMIWLEFERKKRPELYIKFYSMPTILTAGVLVVAWFIVRNILSI